MFPSWLGWPTGRLTLAVYGMNKLPRVNYITARSSFIGNERLQLNTVCSLARFVGLHLHLFVVLT